MSDSYQAIYDAVRSRISNGDVGEAVSRAAYDQFDISRVRDMVQQELCYSAAVVKEQMTRPSVLFRPDVYPDGDKWCALLGTDLQTGVCGFGDSPNEACIAFDKAWVEKTTFPKMAERK